MKYCRYCGKQLPDQAKFCSGCGKPSPVLSPVQSTTVESPIPATDSIPLTVDDIIEEMHIPEEDTAAETPLTVDEIIEEVNAQEPEAEAPAFDTPAHEPPVFAPPPAKKKMPIWLWIVIGVVAAAAVAIVLIFTVFGGGAAKEETLDYLDGDWYGWWMITDADGDFKDMTGYWWDCCVRFDAGRGDSLDVKIWDETCPRKDPLAAAELTLDRKGIASVDSGRFLDGEIEKGSWDISPDNSSYKNAIAFMGTHEDPHGDGTLTYYFLLRPWGEDWDDIARKSEDDVPYLYESWYLPLIEEGAKMPDTVG